jgi:hypothetical protein
MAQKVILSETLVSVPHGEVDFSIRLDLSKLSERRQFTKRTQ